MRVGILTSGGDCPGLNAVIRSAVRKGERTYGHEFVGFLDGYDGLVSQRYEKLDVGRCRGILPRGGTILGTSRYSPQRNEGGVDAAVAAFDEVGLDALIAIGGEGSLSIAKELHEQHGLPIVGVPKTIDNDISVTQFTFGFNTAVEIATEAIDRLHTTAESHDRVMVVEVMGRHVGWIAMYAGVAGGATEVLIPERPFDIGGVCERLKKRHEAGRYASIIVVAEGAEPAAGTMPAPPKEEDEFGHIKLGGTAYRVASEIEKRTGFETRVVVIGHVQRGGSPSAYDRVLASRFGVAAADAVHEHAWGEMVALQDSQIVRVPIADAVAKLKVVPDAFIEQFGAGFFGG